MSTVITRSAFSFLLLASLVLDSVCAPPFLNAQIKSNLSSSVTSESMTAVWVARERGLFKKHGLDMQFILMPRNPLAVINSYERAPHTSLEGMKRLQVLLTQINPKIAEVRVENVIDSSFMNKLESSGYIQSVYKKN
jgi:hypothetical protein